MRRSQSTLLMVAGLLAVAGIVWAAGTPSTPEHSRSATRRDSAMTPEERSRLLTNQQRFERLPDDEKQRLRKVQQEISSESETSDLRGVLDRYDQWLSELPYADSSSVRSLPPTERLKKITAARKKESQAQIVTREQEKYLTDRDWHAIRRWWADFVKRHEQQIIAKLPTQTREMLEHLPPHRRIERLQVIAIIQRKKKSRDRPTIKPSPQDVKKLVASLSSEPRLRLEQMKSPESQLAAVARWIQADMRRRAHKAFAPYVDKKELGNFFRSEISKEDQARLKKLPDDQRRRELAKRYIQWRMNNRSSRGPHAPGHGGPHRPDHSPDHRPDRGPGHHPPRRGDRSKPPSGPDRPIPGDQPPAREAPQS